MEGGRIVHVCVFWRRVEPIGGVKDDFLAGEVERLADRQLALPLDVHDPCPNDERVVFRGLLDRLLYAWIVWAADF